MHGTCPANGVIEKTFLQQNTDNALHTCFNRWFFTTVSDLDDFE